MITTIKTNFNEFKGEIEMIKRVLRDEIQISDACMEKINKRIEECDFYCYNASLEPKIEYENGKLLEELVVEREKGITRFIPDNLEKDKLICIIRNDLQDFETFRNNKFCQIIHVISAQKNGEDSYNFGFMKNKKLGFNYKILNECITEMITKYIYDRIFPRKYRIVYDIDNFKYCRGYFYICDKMLNAFEENPKRYIEAYINNDIEMLKKLLDSECNISLFSLENMLINIEMRPKNAYFNKIYKIKMYIMGSLNSINNYDVKAQYDIFIDRI